MRITLLGSGGWIPTKQRETCSALLRWEQKAILIDAGTGVSRLRDPSLLEGVEELNIVLTHFHLDHIVGLAYLPGLLREPPTIFAPGEFLGEGSSKKILSNFLSPPYHPVPLDQSYKEIRELNEENEILGLPLHLRRQDNHSTPTAALRFGDSFALFTDTGYDKENLAFAEGVGTVFHEAWSLHGEETWGYHSLSAEAARFGREDRDLYLLHISPFAPEAELLRQAQEVFPGTRLGHDLLRIPLDR